MRQTFLLANTLHDPDPALTQYLEQRCIVMLGRRPKPARPYTPSSARSATLEASLNSRVLSPFRLVGAPIERRSFELGGLAAPASGYYAWDDIQAQARAAMAAPIPYGQPFAPGAVAARLMARNRHWYWNEAQDAMLPLGQISARALTHHEDQAAFSDFWLAAEFGNLANDAQLRGQAGLVADGEGYWVAPGAVRAYALPGEPALYHQETGTLWSSPDAAPTARPPSATTFPMRRSRCAPSNTWTPRLRWPPRP